MAAGLLSCGGHRVSSQSPKTTNSNLHSQWYMPPDLTHWAFQQILNRSLPFSLYTHAESHRPLKSAKTSSNQIQITASED